MQSSDAEKKTKNGKRRKKEKRGTYSASRDCCSPVPQMTTSQTVSDSDSMIPVLRCRDAFNERLKRTLQSMGGSMETYRKITCCLS